MDEPVPHFPKPVHPHVDAALERQQRAAFIAAALSWVGTPYRQLGYTKGPKGAVDCSMLLVGALVEGRVFEPFDPRPYSPNWFLARSEEKYLAWLDTIGAPTTNPKPGDVIVYKMGRCYAHSAIIVDDRVMVHAYSRERRCTKTERTWPDLAKREHIFYDFWSRLRGGA
jgi:cell wall-associated NlpC family hydrolase